LVALLKNTIFFVTFWPHLRAGTPVRLLFLCFIDTSQHHRDNFTIRENLPRMAQLTSNVHEMRGGANVAHIPPMPLWVAIIRIFQLVSNAFASYYELCSLIFKVLAIIILALTAFAASVFNVTVSFAILLTIQTSAD
jgi:hypothetical protein